MAQQHQPDTEAWRLMMETLNVGALRGMAEAYRAVSAQMPGALPSLNDRAMFDASVILAALLLEQSTACEHSRDFPGAAREVGKDVLAHMKKMREHREQTGKGMFETLFAQAGLERQRAN